LLSERSTSRAVVILLEDDRDSESLARMLKDLSAEGSRLGVFVPPVRGIEFFADSGAQPQIDAWWDVQIDGDAHPIFVIDHREDLGGWLVGLDGPCYVGVASASEAAEYGAYPDVRIVRARSPLDYAAAVMGGLVEAGVYAAQEATRMNSLASALPAPTSLLGDEASRPLDSEDGEGPDPFDLLIAMNGHVRAGAAADPMSQVPATTREGRSHRRGIRLPDWARRAASGGNHADEVDRDLAGELIRRGSTIVAVGSRKGGVGKTSHAAGVAIVAGVALDAVGRCAALLDANLANPDAWGQLNLPLGAATVRDMIAALASNQEPPRPVHASTAALACFPESREASEYSRSEIGMLVAHLRSRYPLVVVDLSNRLPDPTGGPEAAAAAYWLEHADVLVLPCAASKQDFNGVLDYLEIADIPPVIVASLVPRARRNREHPLAKRYMSAIVHRAYRVIDIPDEAELVRYAGMQGVPVESISGSLKAAYRRLADAIAAAPPSTRS
jgi:hypothetical protein